MAARRATATSDTEIGAKKTKAASSKKKAAVKKTTSKKATSASNAKSARTKTKSKAKRTSVAQPKVTRPTLASISAQLTLLTEQVAVLTRQLAETRASSNGSATRGAVDASNGAPSGAAADAIDVNEFEPRLLSVLGQLDRRGRYGGLVPIPEIRKHFAEHGWSRREFDARLLQAERDFLIDLKTANDPSRLAEPDLAIVEPGRGHLQFVVVR